MMTLRIDPDLLAALGRRAKEEGRTVSAEVVRPIRKELGSPPRRPKPARTMGMFRDFEAPDLEEFRRLRGELSGAFRRRVRGSRRSG